MGVTGAVATEQRVRGPRSLTYKSSEQIGAEKRARSPGH